MDSVVPEFKIAKLDLNPGDVLVLTAPTSMPDSYINRIHLILDNLFPNNKHLILASDYELSVVGPSE